MQMQSTFSKRTRNYEGRFSIIANRQAVKNKQLLRNHVGYRHKDRFIKWGISKQARKGSKTYLVDWQREKQKWTLLKLINSTQKWRNRGVSTQCISGFWISAQLSHENSFRARDFGRQTAEYLLLLPTICWAYTSTYMPTQKSNRA